MGKIFALTLQPTDYILSLHLAQLVKHFGGDEVRRTFRFIQLDSDDLAEYIWADPLERHIGNLCNTYGRRHVIEFYQMIWGIDKKVA
jgi:hypothetical protein